MPPYQGVRPWKLSFHLGLHLSWRFRVPQLEKQKTVLVRRRHVSGHVHLPAGCRAYQRNFEWNFAGLPEVPATWGPISVWSHQTSLVCLLGTTEPSDESQHFELVWRIWEGEEVRVDGEGRVCADEETGIWQNCQEEIASSHSMDMLR